MKGIYQQWQIPFSLTEVKYYKSICLNLEICMAKILDFLKKEFLEVLPAVIFFFIAFHLLSLTESLILSEHGVPASTMALVSVSALIVGKAILIADKLPFINRFPDKPLIYNIAWKTFIYLLIAFLFRYLEALIPKLLKHQSWTLAHQNIQSEIVWQHFFVVQIWLLVLLFVYSIGMEIVKVIGKPKILEMLFGA